MVSAPQNKCRRRVYDGRWKGVSLPPEKAHPDSLVDSPLPCFQTQSPLLLDQGASARTRTMRLVALLSLALLCQAAAQDVGEHGENSPVIKWEDPAGVC
jgi:hypothetical protein